MLTAAAVLAEVDRGMLTLDHHVSYDRTDLESYAPIAKKYVGQGYMTVSDLCAAAVQWSDNTADNLLLKLIGGPAGWTRYARSIGDRVSRLDRFEPALNPSLPGDPRDTSTPTSMVRQLDTLLLGKPLGEKSRKRLNDWLFGTQITGNLLHAGLPKGWRVGDKSGAGERGSRNDVGILLPPRGGPIVVAVLYTGSEATMAAREHVIAEVGRIVSETFSA